MKKEILRKIRKIILSKKFKERHKASEKDFTRQRKLGFKEIILFQLRNAGKSLGVEIQRYLGSIRKLGMEYSKQAYCQARLKIRDTGYIELNETMLEEYYGNCEYKTYKGYRLLGIDGTELELQHGSEIKKKYGRIFTNNESINASKSVLVYDLLNELVIDAELNKYNSSERVSAILQLKRMGSKGQKRHDIIVCDRGFPSLAMFSELLFLGYDFVFRYNGENFLEETLPLVSSKLNEIEIELCLSKGNKRSVDSDIKRMLSEGHPEKIRLRILKIGLPSGTIEYLITSILEDKGFTIEDFKEIYNCRWNEEVYFNFQKNVMEVENFSGKSIESIKQDYYSRILVGNLHTLVVSDAQEEIEAETKKEPQLKYREYKVNKSISFGLLKDSLYRLLTTSNWQKEYALLIKEAKKYKIAVIKNRTFVREKKGNLKFPINKKRIL